MGSAVFPCCYPRITDVSGADLKNWVAMKSAYQPDCASSALLFELCEVCEFDVCGAEIDEGVLLVTISMLEVLDSIGSTDAAGGIGCLPAVAISWCCFRRLSGTPVVTGMCTVVFSVFVVEQGMAEMYPLLAHVTDGARSRDATSAVLGKSPVEWLRMGLCCSGERCHADARWKR
ncbi:hypothetical protein Nepgr_005300 [Nepenthes gracilis]|uniref:Uncharacterized protein n=1 Tax=Nepenthes gracilis TaxID=150966 RepID=A0AAD3S327_NEPGR|nr:hypothetical protein Nepgr_005300 [Nepenthes gracilis]